jgi:hypothetical protein
MLVALFQQENRTSGPKGHRGGNVLLGDKSPAYPKAKRVLSQPVDLPFVHNRVVPLRESEEDYGAT